MTIDSRALTPSILLLAAAALLLTGCAASPTPSGGDDSGASDGGGSSASDAKGPKCEDNTSDYKIYSDPAISTSPEYGQAWGDGSDFSVTYDDYTDGTLGYDLGYVQDNGGVIPMSGGFFPDPVDKTFTSADLNFDSASEGYYGIVTVSITQDTTTTELGNYCVLLKTSD